MYFVKKTVRFRPCDPNSGIKALALDKKIGQFDIFDNAQLKPIADAEQLWVYNGETCRSARVYIYWSPTYNRWIASTVPDGIECNNLLSLPILRAVNQTPETITYNDCPL